MYVWYSSGKEKHVCCILHEQHFNEGHSDACQDYLHDFAKPADLASDQITLC